MSVARGFPNAGHFYSNIVKPIKIDCNFIVDSTNGNGLGIRSLKSNGYVRNVFMHTSATPGKNDNYTNPNPASGYALIQMKQNFNTYLGGFSGFVSPVTGSNITVSSSSVLTAGAPYVITAVGTAAAPSFTVVAVADSSGSLAGKYFLASDQYSNNYLFYNVVSGVGLPPSLTGALANYVAIPVTFATNATNSTVGAAIATAMAAVNNTNSWTAVNSGHTVTVTGLLTTANFSPFPQDVSTGFTVSTVTYTSLTAGWAGIGVPPGLIPAVGLSFIATATGGASVTSGTVKAVGVSGISSVEVIGDANQSINNASIASNGGAWVLVQFLGSTVTIGSYTPAGTVGAPVFTGNALGTHTHSFTPAGTNDGASPPIFTGTPGTTGATSGGTPAGTNSAPAFTGTPATLTGTVAYAAAAPAAGSVVGMSFFFDGSAVTVDGL